MPSSKVAKQRFTRTFGHMFEDSGLSKAMIMRKREAQLRPSTTMTTSPKRNPKFGTLLQQNYLTKRNKNNISGLTEVLQHKMSLDPMGNDSSALLCQPNIILEIGERKSKADSCLKQGNLFSPNESAFGRSSRKRLSEQQRSSQSELSSFQDSPRQSKLNDIQVVINTQMLDKSFNNDATNTYKYKKQARVRLSTTPNNLKISSSGFNNGFLSPQIVPKQRPRPSKQIAKFPLHDDSQSQFSEQLQQQFLQFYQKENRNYRRQQTMQNRMAKVDLQKSVKDQYLNEINTRQYNNAVNNKFNKCALKLQLAWRRFSARKQLKKLQDSFDRKYNREKVRILLEEIEKNLLPRKQIFEKEDEEQKRRSQRHKFQEKIINIGSLVVDKSDSLSSLFFNSSSKQEDEEENKSPNTEGQKSSVRSSILQGRLSSRTPTASKLKIGLGGQGLHSTFKKNIQGKQTPHKGDRLNEETTFSNQLIHVKRQSQRQPSSPGSEESLAQESLWSMKTNQSNSLFKRKKSNMSGGASPRGMISQFGQLQTSFLRPLMKNKVAEDIFEKTQKQLQAKMQTQKLKFILYRDHNKLTHKHLVEISNSLTHFSKQQKRKLKQDFINPLKLNRVQQKNQVNTKAKGGLIGIGLKGAVNIRPLVIDQKSVVKKQVLLGRPLNTPFLQARSLIGESPGVAYEKGGIVINKGAGGRALGQQFDWKISLQHIDKKPTPDQQFKGPKLQTPNQDLKTEISKDKEKPESIQQKMQTEILPNYIKVFFGKKQKNLILQEMVDEKKLNQSFRAKKPINMWDEAIIGSYVSKDNSRSTANQFLLSLGFITPKQKEKKKNLHQRECNIFLNQSIDSSLKILNDQVNQVYKKQCAKILKDETETEILGIKCMKIKRRPGFLNGSRIAQYAQEDVNLLPQKSVVNGANNFNDQESVDSFMFEESIEEEDDNESDNDDEIRLPKSSEQATKDTPVQSPSRQSSGGLNSSQHSQSSIQRQARRSKQVNLAKDYFKRDISEIRKQRHESFSSPSNRRK